MNDSDIYLMRLLHQIPGQEPDELPEDAEPAEIGEEEAEDDEDDYAA